jgi:hypothetical protein
MSEVKWRDRDTAHSTQHTHTKASFVDHRSAHIEPADGAERLVVVERAGGRHRFAQSLRFAGGLQVIPQMHQTHFVLSESAGFVGRNDRARTQRLHRLELFHEHIALGQFASGQRQT